MSNTISQNLSRRERQIMDAVYQRDRATAAEVQEGMPEAPSYSAVRAMLKILVDKGALKIEKDGPRYVYSPTKARRQAGQSAIKNVMETFFEGSVEKAVAALLDTTAGQLSSEESKNIQRLIQEARKEGR
ncbi:MAG: BlaI/MecI/CopY family transcriptional regulator [Limisphaerales bacterium]